MREKVKGGGKSGKNYEGVRKKKEGRKKVEGQVCICAHYYS